MEKGFMSSTFNGIHPNHRYESAMGRGSLSTTLSGTNQSQGYLGTMLGGINQNLARTLEELKFQSLGATLDQIKTTLDQIEEERAARSLGRLFDMGIGFDEFLIEMFFYLDIKDLLNCKLVCKQWKIFIDWEVWRKHPAIRNYWRWTSGLPVFTTVNCGEPVSHLALDGSMLVCVIKSGGIMVVDHSCVVAMLEGTTDQVWRVTIGARVILAVTCSHIMVWNRATFDLVGKLKHGSDRQPYLAVKDDILVVPGKNRHATRLLLYKSTGHLLLEVANFNHGEAWVLGADMDCPWVVTLAQTASGSRTTQQLRLWNCFEGKCLKTFDIGTGVVSGVRMGFKYPFTVVSTKMKTLSVWDLSQPSAARAFVRKIEMGVQGLKIKGQFLYIVDDRSNLKVYRMRELCNSSTSEVWVRILLEGASPVFVVNRDNIVSVSSNAEEKHILLTLEISAVDPASCKKIHLKPPKTELATNHSDLAIHPESLPQQDRDVLATYDRLLETYDEIEQEAEKQNSPYDNMDLELHDDYSEMLDGNLQNIQPDWEQMEVKNSNEIEEFYLEESNLNLPVMKRQKLNNDDEDFELNLPILKPKGKDKLLTEKEKSNESVISEGEIEHCWSNEDILHMIDKEKHPVHCFCQGQLGMEMKPQYSKLSDIIETDLAHPEIFHLRTDTENHVLEDEDEVSQNDEHELHFKEEYKGVRSIDERENAQACSTQDILCMTDMEEHTIHCFSQELLNNKTKTVFFELSDIESDLVHPEMFLLDVDGENLALRDDSESSQSDELFTEEESVYGSSISEREIEHSDSTQDILNMTDIEKQPIHINILHMNSEKKPEYSKVIDIESDLLHPEQLSYIDIQNLVLEKNDKIDQIENNDSITDLKKISNENHSVELSQDSVNYTTKYENHEQNNISDNMSYGVKKEEENLSINGACDSDEETDEQDISESSSFTNEDSEELLLTPFSISDDDLDSDDEEFNHNLYTVDWFILRKTIKLYK